MQGSHLITHDDVIDTRCISYVIYLSDPDDEWTKDDGGRLTRASKMSIFLTKDIRDIRRCIGAVSSCE